MLAVVSRECYELVEDRLLLARRHVAVSRSNGLNQFLACSHADSPLLGHILPPPAYPTSNNLHEATGHQMWQI